MLAGQGRLDVVAALRAMAVAPGGDAALVELKAVDPATYRPPGTSSPIRRDRSRTFSPPGAGCPARSPTPPC